ncbi:class I SAM-dependent methyltransferase [Nonomuraea sp. NPDC050328]|uniref:class I SAM-dependent methyltransferase n=1 Tax=Nonomuraea sp. NPDC050328 TaxID=3364361 RepID=UPI0037A366B4
MTTTPASPPTRATPPASPPAPPPTEAGLWDQQADDWAEIQEAQCTPLFEAALAALDLRPGSTVLDVGCGSGLALALAAARGAEVSGLDAAPELVRIARRRVPGAADLSTGTLDGLPYADRSFDVVMSFNALRYAADPVAAVAGFARKTRYGGAVCLGGWGEPDRCETTGFLFSVVAALPRPPQGSQGEAANTPAQIRSVMRRAGLEPVTTGEVACPFVYASVEAAWMALSSTGLLRFAIGHLGEPAVRALFDTAFAGSVRPDGTVRQENVFEYSIARVGAPSGT